MIRSIRGQSIAGASPFFEQSKASSKHSPQKKASLSEGKADAAWEEGTEGGLPVKADCDGAFTTIHEAEPLVDHTGDAESPRSGVVADSVDAPVTEDPGAGPKQHLGRSAEIPRSMTPLTS